VQVGVVADDALLQRLSSRITSRGEILRVKRASVLRGGQKNTWLEIVLDEGRNRHIRRIFEQMDIEVLRLIRVAIGSLALGGLPKGELRELTEAEKRTLNAVVR